MFNSDAAVTPSKIFNSAAVEVKAVPPIVTVETLNVVNEPAAAVELQLHYCLLFLQQLNLGQLNHLLL